MKKIIISIVICVLFFLSSRHVAFAYETDSNTVTTRIGNPPVASGSGALTDVLSWAQKINDAEELGAGGRYDRMTTTISNNGYSTNNRTGQVDGGLGPDGVYWCTFLVVDSYNLAGITGPKIPDDAAVVTLISFWEHAPGFQYIDYYHTQNLLNLVQPGYAIFFQQSPGATGIGDLDHTAIVKTITVNSHGDGTIETIDANTSGGKDLTYQVVGWNILVNWGSTVVGFGRH